MSIRRVSSLLVVMLAVAALFLHAAEPVPDPPAKLQASGNAVPALAAFDQAMIRYLTEHQFKSGVLAVSRRGKIVLQRGYGWSDADRSVVTSPSTPMRIASISKPITAAAIRKLIAAGKLSLDTKVFGLLGVDPPPGGSPDPRLKLITVGHLLEHEGGWDRDRAFDPMFHDAEIQAALKIDHPPDAAEIIRHMVGQPLQFDPGAKSVYSNFGYCVLGRVIEKISKQPYIDHVRKAIAAPSGMNSLALARSLARDRPGNEVWYDTDEGLHMERMDSHGGLIVSAPDLCRFMRDYWITGFPRKANDDQNAQWVFYGSLPGTTSMAMQRADGVDIAVIVNGRDERDGVKDPLDSLNTAMNRAADSIKRWP